ncbi:isoamyl acetate-hydrolyzing esterase [Linderina pennispora]|nr:isoamyl acetate-hydrolyzing esterase [Linderina pennispora]
MKLFTNRLWSARYFILFAVAALLCINYLYFASEYGRLSDDGEEGHRHSPAKPFTGAMYGILLAIGDSITQFGGDPSNSGFLAQLSRDFERRLDVLNRGFSGYNTNNILEFYSSLLPVTRHNTQGSWWRRSPSPVQGRGQRLPLAHWPHRDQTFPTHSPAVQLVMLFFGANDAALPLSGQHVPLQTYTENLRTMVNQIQDPQFDTYSPGTRILLITPPPIGDKMWEETCTRHNVPVDRINTVTRTYADAVKMVAKEKGIPVVDLYGAIESLVGASKLKNPLFKAAADGSLDRAQQQHVFGMITDIASPYDGYEMYLADGLHLNRNGNKLLARLILTTVISEWPEMRPVV